MYSAKLSIATDQKVGGSNPSGCANVMSRDTVGRCLGTSLHFLAGRCEVLILLLHPILERGIVLAGVKAGALRVACGQP